MATENYSGSSQGTAMYFATTPNGGIQWIERMRINHDGALIHNTVPTVADDAALPNGALCWHLASNTHWCFASAAPTASCAREPSRSTNPRKEQTRIWLSIEKSRQPSVPRSPRTALSMRSETLPADPPPTPEDVEFHDRHQALAKRILDQPYQTVDVIFPRLMANQQAQDRANDLASSSLSGAVETALDTQLQTFVEGFIEEYV